MVECRQLWKTDFVLSNLPTSTLIAFPLKEGEVTSLISLTELHANELFLWLIELCWQNRISFLSQHVHNLYKPQISHLYTCNPQFFDPFITDTSQNIGKILWTKKVLQKSNWLCVTGVSFCDFETFQPSLHCLDCLTSSFPGVHSCQPPASHFSKQKSAS